MASLQRLLSHGYFPLEAPQPFTTRSYGRVVSAHRTSLPAEFAPSSKTGRLKTVAQLARHNLARAGQFARVLEIPNPVLFYNLAAEIVSSWPAIAVHISPSPVSATTPRPTNTGVRAIITRSSPSAWPRLRARYRAGSRYVLITDIQQFYPSLYTHSIPWGLHTKAHAKANRNDWSLLGNRLDFWVRQAQDQQTRGIPIGPDTSLVIAEILLKAVDEQLESLIGRLKGFRAIDNYELSFDSRSAAEQALAILQSILLQYELRLNGTKTRIEQLPSAFEDTWTNSLRRFNIRSNTRVQIGDLLSYFSLTFELARQHPEKPILRYAIARLQSVNLKRASWLTYQDILYQCIASEPGTIQYALSELRRYQRTGMKLNLDCAQDTLSNVITQHVPLGQGSEVAWAVWSAIVLSVPIPDHSASLLPKIDDPLVPLLALDASVRGLITSLDTTSWEAPMTRDDLWGRHWLLAYEANVKNWLPSVTSSDHVTKDPCFRFLKRNGVSFYNVRASGLPIRRWRAPFSLGQLIGYGI